MRIFERQWLHLAFLIVAIPLLTIVSELPGFYKGSVLNITTRAWFWSAVWIAVIHQVYVWFCWRIELYKKGLTRLLGDFAFTVYSAGFSILGISRVLAVYFLAVSNQAALPLDDLLGKSLGVLLLGPVLYLFYSVKKYFGFKRAFGIDHFDEAYRSLPFVREGIFQYTGNAMYTFGFLILWIPAFWFGSQAALAAAIFNHLYIWVHYYTTERPDIRHIYG